MAKLTLPPRPSARRTTPLPGDSLSTMALTDEEAVFFATPPEPSADDTWTDAPSATADQTWIETPLPRSLQDPEQDLEDVEWSGDVALPSPEIPTAHRAGPFRLAAAGIFAALVAVAFLSTTRRSTVPTVYAAERVMAYRKAPMTAIPAVTAQPEPTQEIEILNAPTPPKIVKVEAKPAPKAKAVTKPAVQKSPPRKPSKVKSSF